jgi:hypothetical protein
MRTKIITLSLSALFLVGCGQKETIREVLVTAPPATEAPAPEMSKYDQYLELLYGNSAQAREWSESDLLELGTLVCETFDDGGTLDQVLTIFSNNSTGKYDDELYSSVVAGAVMFLCPEWADYVQSQI